MSYACMAACLMHAWLHVPCMYGCMSYACIAACPMHVWLHVLCMYGCMSYACMAACPMHVWLYVKYKECVFACHMKTKYLSFILEFVYMRIKMQGPVIAGPLASVGSRWPGMADGGSNW